MAYLRARSIRRRRRSEPEAVSNVLSRWLGRQQIQAELCQYALWTKWDEIAGERLAARTRPTSLRDGQLTLVVASSAWLNELSFLRGELVRRINEVLGREEVKTIRFLAGIVPPPKPRFTREPAARPDPRREPSPEEASEAARSVEAVPDRELAGAILRARLAWLRRR
jgi:predicted nucleic acid-binding Zn ribbon protein